MAAPTFDLQAHSLHSDGELPAAEVVTRAAEAGVELFALSDHDTVDGVQEALNAGAQAGIRVVPAVEISAVGEGEGDLHLLGYGIEHDDARLRARLEEYRADRELRAERMTERLEESGFALERAPLDARRAAGKPIGRPHLATAALSHGDNAARLEAEDIVEVGDFIESYLVPGAPAWLPRRAGSQEAGYRRGREHRGFSDRRRASGNEAVRRLPSDVGRRGLDGRGGGSRSHRRGRR